MTILASLPVGYVDTLSRAQLIASVLFGLLLLHLLIYRFNDGLSSIPGPALAKYTRLWKLYDAWSGQTHWTTIRLHRKYGDAVRIGPNHVTLNHPQAIAEIYSLSKPFMKVRRYLYRSP
jgi:hypothetical protein